MTTPAQQTHMKDIIIPLDQWLSQPGGAVRVLRAGVTQMDDLFRALFLLADAGIKNDYLVEPLDAYTSRRPPIPPVQRHRTPKDYRRKPKHPQPQEVA